MAKTQKMSCEERCRRLDALKESLAIDALDAVWDDSFELGKLGKCLRNAIHTDGESYDYAYETAKNYMLAQIELCYAGLDECM